MIRKTIIKIDFCLLNELTGDFDFRMSIDNDFIETFKVDKEVIVKDLKNMLDKICNEGE